MNAIFRSYRAVCSCVPELIQTRRLTGQFATSVPEQIEVSEPLSSSKWVWKPGCTMWLRSNIPAWQDSWGRHCDSAINFHQVLDLIKYGSIRKWCSHVKSLMGENIIHLKDWWWRTWKEKHTIIPLKKKNKRIKSRQWDIAEEYEVKGQYQWECCRLVPREEKTLYLSHWKLDWAGYQEHYPIS